MDSNQKIEKIAEEIVFSERPIWGVFYYVPLNREMTKWKFIGLKAVRGINPVHYDLWKNKIIPYFKNDLKLTSEEIKKLSERNHGLPRGRIFTATEFGLPEDQIKIGKDLPQINKQEILDFFNLKKYKFIYWNHENMYPEDKEIVWKVIQNKI